jgi:hypothetical protein
MQQLREFSQSRVVPSTELLARLLCYGLRLPADIPDEYLARHGLVHHFIQGSIFMVGGIRPINTVVWKADAARGVPLLFRNNELWIEDAAGLLACSPLEQPLSITATVGDYGRIGDYLKFHNRNTVFASPIRECIFGAIGKPCQFCTFEMTKPKPLPPDIFVEMFLRVVEGRRNISLALGPGTPNLRDHGVGYIQSLIKELSKKWQGPISVELVPPHDLDDLASLIDTRVGSVIMSLEVWNDEIRERVCPGKSYVSKDSYVKAWQLVTERLGPGKVSGVLLIGLESAESAKLGIDFMVERGIVPTLIPFRPYENTLMSSHDVTDHNMYIDISRYNVAKMRQHRIGPKSQVGCTECGGCSLDIETSL